jgi:hypothetical protein
VGGGHRIARRQAVDLQAVAERAVVQLLVEVDQNRGVAGRALRAWDRNLCLCAQLGDQVVEAAGPGRADEGQQRDQGEAKASGTTTCAGRSELRDSMVNGLLRLGVFRR